MMGHAFSGTDPKTVPIPHMKKYSVKRRKLEWDEVLMSSGVFAISKANRPKPDENRPAAMSEQSQGPWVSLILPTTAARGYWPIIPLR